MATPGHHGSQEIKCSDEDHDALIALLSYSCNFIFAGSDTTFDVHSVVGHRVLKAGYDFSPVRRQKYCHFCPWVSSTGMF